MSVGPQGQVRPANPIALAVQVCRIATGEAEEEIKQPVVGAAASDQRKSKSSGRKSDSAPKKK